MDIYNRLVREQGATMNQAETERHMKKLEKLRKYLAQQGDDMMVYPEDLPKTVFGAKLLTGKLKEDLRAWFGKGKKGGVGGGGWDRYNTSGDRVGKCGDAKEGDAYAACLSKEKARKLGKAGRAAFVKRKRAAQKKGGDAKKGGERSKGQKPIKVKTGVKESISVNTAYDKIDRLPHGKIFNDAKRIDGIFNKSKHSYSEVIEAFEKNKAKNNIEFVSVNDVHITQPNIQSNKVKQTITSFDDTATINVVQFPDGEMAIYDGHHRLTAAWAIGKDKIKVNLVKTGIKKEIALREYTPSNPADIDKAIRVIEKLGVRNPIKVKTGVSEAHGKTLHVYDFDDTLVKTNATVIVKRPDGSKYELKSDTFATYRLKPGERYDFSNFDKIIHNSLPISRNIDQIKRSLRNPSIKTTILTARRVAFPIMKHLRDNYGINAYVIAVGSSDPEVKADWIETQVNNGYQNIKFMDDSVKNLNAVARRLSDKKVNLTLINALTDKPYNVPDMERISEILANKKLQNKPGK